MDHFIGPLVPLSNSYIKDSTHMINILNAMEELPPEVLKFTLVVSSMYTNITQEEGITAIQEMLSTHWSPHDLPHINYIVN